MTISLEEEYGSTLRTQIVCEPFYAHVVVDNIASYGYAWIDITASNQYGTAFYTEEIEPSNYAKKDIVSYIPSKKERNNIEHMDIHDLFGNNIFSLKDEEELSRLEKGIYVLTYYLWNRNPKRIKYIAK